MSAELALRPHCDGCGEFLELRNPAGGWTPEQRFCGVWYDHPMNRCGKKLTSVPYPSRALTDQLSELTLASH